MEHYSHFHSDKSHYTVRDAKYYDKGMVDPSVDFDLCFFLTSPAKRAAFLPSRRTVCDNISHLLSLQKPKSIKAGNKFSGIIGRG